MLRRSSSVESLSPADSDDFQELSLKGPMAKRTDNSPRAAGRAGDPRHQAPRRQGISGIDVVVVLAMAAASVAAGVALHLQADLGTMSSGAMAASLFVLVAFIHVQRLRIDRLRTPQIDHRRSMIAGGLGRLGRPGRSEVRRGTPGRSAVPRPSCAPQANLKRAQLSSFMRR